ncbi:hypothetical protein GCM10007276_05900 [Agaricicola taiwanensis]|uniref:Mut7-C RNAse domain-containing protein n=1 Tax=Agaricicola taiwanensis TaxID=591372 RepID=A0A8J2YG02_9RHOB|nr:hypothetical protein GCM10007276_05900 [Agaricicola taiwanensis]
MILTMRLLCDEMLIGLARWLRAAGYDAATVDPGTRDADVVSRLEEEGRFLITRDRRLAETAGAAAAFLLAHDDLDQQAECLAAMLYIDWMLRPFSRCLVDNTPLRDAGPDEVERMPLSARELGGPFRACPLCGRFYWPGSHVKRMMTKLRQWRRPARSGGGQEALKGTVW